MMTSGTRTTLHRNALVINLEARLLPRLYVQEGTSGGNNNNNGVGVGVCHNSRLYILIVK
jgi:hypothetical protein